MMHTALGTSIMAMVVAAATQPQKITTTLYDLLTAMQEVTTPDDDERLVAAIAYGLHSGKITFLRHQQVLGTN